MAIFTSGSFKAELHTIGLQDNYFLVLKSKPRKNYLESNLQEALL